VLAFVFFSLSHVIDHPENRNPSWKKHCTPATNIALSMVIAERYILTQFARIPYKMSWNKRLRHTQRNFVMQVCIFIGAGVHVGQISGLFLGDASTLQKGESPAPRFVLP
jgi:hypothetical protein